MDFVLGLLMSPQGGSPEGGAALFVNMVPLLLIFVIFYFLLIRPQQKKQKEHQKLLSELKKGDRVVTNSGMFGTIATINEEKNIVVLRISDDVKIEMLKSSVAGRVD